MFHRLAYRVENLPFKEKTVLITGVTGFAGSYIAGYLRDSGYHVIGAARRQQDIEGIEFYKISNLDESSHWQPALEKADFVVHLAGRAHQMREKPGNDHLYFAVNVDGTLNLARQAVAAGIKKFVFASTVKAMGEGGEGIIYRESDACMPGDAYGKSKFKAELELLKIAADSDLQVVNLRPPLMYGPGVKGNMATLIRLVKTFPFLPLGGLKNRRSFMAIHNFASAVQAVLEADEVGSATYLVSDGEAVSTSELIDRILQAYSPGCRNFALPEICWKILTKIPLVADRVGRLSGSLEIDSSAFCRELSWQPPYTMLEQLKEMAQK
jgi:UDP-glucose 4-epimerase